MFFDKDGSGYIETNELREALADDSGETDNDVLNDILREVDTDKVRLSSLTFLMVYKIQVPPPLLLLLIDTSLSEHLEVGNKILIVINIWN